MSFTGDCARFLKRSQRRKARENSKQCVHWPRCNWRTRRSRRAEVAQKYSKCATTFTGVSRSSAISAFQKHSPIICSPVDCRPWMSSCQMVDWARVLQRFEERFLRKGAVEHDGLCFRIGRVNGQKRNRITAQFPNLLVDLGRWIGLVR